MTSLMSVPDSCKAQIPSSGSQALTSPLAFFLVSWLAPLLFAVTAAKSPLEVMEAKLACLDSVLLLVIPLVLDLAQ